MKLVERKGQKFQFQDLILEDESFSSENGIKFETAEDAINANSNSKICVRNKEFGGHTQLNLSYLIE